MMGKSRLMKEMYERTPSQIDESCQYMSVILIYIKYYHDDEDRETVAANITSRHEFFEDKWIIDSKKRGYIYFTRIRA